MLTDQNFPIIEYNYKLGPLENGKKHGESFRVGINELVSIRKNLLINKNPALKNDLNYLSVMQFEATKKYAPGLATELEGIAIGANVSIEDIVILNNYTDFRDIGLENEGCTTLHLMSGQESICGQTWDMHSSAKNYVCLIHVPGDENRAGQIYFSLVGCLGMMGANTHRLLVGVNNINTKNAEASIIWPALIRNGIDRSSNFETLEKMISQAPVTSGHNYLISSSKKGAMWEVSPVASEKVADLSFFNGKQKSIYHTNHCIGQRNKEIEAKISLNSTTHDRYNILESNLLNINSFEDVQTLLHGHENYPKSICSHYESSDQDPSTTCGGGIFDLNQGNLYMWRGCPTYDNNFISYNFKIKDNSFFQMN